MKRLLIILSKDHTLHEMMIGITMANIVLVIIALFVPDRRHALYAVAVGLAISLLYVIHMAVTLDDALNLDEKSAVSEVRKHMVIIYVLTGVAVGAVLYFHIADPVFLVLSVITIKAGAYLQPFVHKLLGRRDSN